jgi:hypothetical protein
VSPAGGDLLAKCFIKVATRELYAVILFAWFLTFAHLFLAAAAIFCPSSRSKSKLRDALCFESD